MQGDGEMSIFRELETTKDPFVLKLSKDIGLLTKKLKNKFENDFSQEKVLERYRNGQETYPIHLVYNKWDEMLPVDSEEYEKRCIRWLNFKINSKRLHLLTQLRDLNICRICHVYKHDKVLKSVYYKENKRIQYLCKYIEASLIKAIKYKYIDKDDIINNEYDEKRERYTPALLALNVLFFEEYRYDTCLDCRSI